MSGEKKESVFDKWKRRDSEQSNALPDIARLSLTSPTKTPKVSGVKLKKKVAGADRIIPPQLHRPTPTPTSNSSKPKIVVSSKLADRMKAFESSASSTPPATASSNRPTTTTTTTTAAGGGEEESSSSTKRQHEQSKKRHELRAQQNKRTTVPKKQANVRASIVNIDTFIPPVYEKSTLDKDLIQKSLKDNFVFENLSNKEMEQFISAFEKMQVHAGNKIINQGDTGDYFYVIGGTGSSVRFEVNGKVVGSASSGKSFGELSLLYTSPRAASVIAESNPTVLFRVDQKTFRYIMKTKAKESESEKMDLLKEINFLKDFSPADLQRLCDCMVPRTFKKDEVVVKKGDAGDAFYILQTGSMKVCDISVGSSTYEDVTLKPGDYFGERALITREKRAANVIGSDAGRCFAIDRVTFEKVLGNFSKVIMKSQDKVKLEGVKVVQEAKLDSSTLENLAQAIVDKKFSAGKYIQERDQDTDAAMYLVREGSVSIHTIDGSVTTIEAGGYFGDEQLLLDAKGIADSQGCVTSDFTAQCGDKDTVCGVLTLQECRLLFDTTCFKVEDEKTNDQEQGGEEYDFRGSTIMKRRSTIRESFQSNKISMDDLGRNELLGEGEFGEVWLVKADIWGIGEEEYFEEFALKVQNLKNPEHEDMVDTVKREMEVISALEHPFIVDMVSSRMSEEESLMLMTIVKGGELWNVVHQEQEDGSWMSGISEADAKFYGLVIADTLAYMHQKNILFRDLKPENVLIDKDGYPNIIDFGFAKFSEDKTYTFCGTPNYVAPEIVLSTGHGVGVDHWALGVVIFEMIAGENPFYYDGLDNGALFEIIAKEDPYPCEKASDDAKDLIGALLEKDPTQRLGVLSGGERDILNHKWFQDLDLNLVRGKNIKAPWIPPASN